MTGFLTATVLKYISGGLLILAGVFFLLYRAEARHADKLEQQIAGLQSELKRISTKKNEQAKVTTRTVEKVVKGDPVVKTVVRTIREAPNPPKCETPALDHLRDVL